MNSKTEIIDVAIVGGGPAGLQAALSLGRVHRSAIVFDSGDYRNATVAHMHNVLTNDGRAPAEFRDTARAELARYATISVVDDAVVSIEPVGGEPVGREEPAGHLLRTSAGVEIRATSVVLATGVADELPNIPGLADLWGAQAAQCPFCHAHEFAGKRIGIIGADAAPHYAQMLGPVAGELVVFGNGADAAVVPGVRGYDAPIVGVAAIAGGAPSGGAVESEQVPAEVIVRLADGGSVAVAAIFVAPTLHQSAPFASQLGLELNPSGAVRIDEFGITNVPGIFCAGDMAHLAAFPMPMASVVMAMAAGQMAGMSALRHVLASVATS